MPNENPGAEDALSPGRFIKELWSIAPADWFGEFFLIRYQPTIENPDAKVTPVMLWTLQQIRDDWSSIETELTRQNQTKVFNIHPCVNPRFRKPKRRGKNSDVSHFMALWVDVDFHDAEAETRKRFWDTVKIFTEAGIPPSIIVESGHGLHAYWLLDKPYLIKEARPCCAGIQDTFQTSDMINDPSRVLRMPGTVNWKDAKHPATCRVIEATYKRYPLEAFKGYEVEPNKSGEDKEEENLKKQIGSSRKSRNKDIEWAKTHIVRKGEGPFGGRHNTAKAMAGHYAADRSVTSLEAAKEKLSVWNKTLCDPPIEDAQIDGCSKHAWENEEEKRKSKKEDLAEDERSDIVAAEQFVSKFGSEFLYCEPWKKWLVWDDRRWTADRRNRAFLGATKIAENSGIKRHKAERIAATLRVSQPMLATVPEEFDRDPWLLNCPNGTLNLKDGSLKGNAPSDHITYLCPTNFNPDAKAPLWEKFLSEIMNGNVGLISYLQRLAGYALTGVIRDHVLPILYGTGANGKSTFLGTLRKVFGADYSCESAPDLLMTRDTNVHPTERADLAGKRLVTTIEVEDGRRLAENFVKQLTGGDELKVRRMREDFWTLKPTWKVFLATNNKPEIRGMDVGIWRRVRLVPFTVRIPDAGQDTELGEKLSVEAEGILAWTVRGCTDWVTHGLRDPKEVLEATEEYKADADLLSRFFSDCCTIIPQARVQASQVYEAFRDWHAKEVGTEPMNGTVFGRRLTEHGFKVEKQSGKKWRIGIGISEIDDKLSSKTRKFYEF